jgi:four helix bundle protein
METEELKRRTKEFGLRVIKLVEQLPRSKTADVIGQQLLRSATSVGANYRAACRARSQADFVSKICVVEEEADESAYWLELLEAAKIVSEAEISSLLKEADELTAIFVASGKTAKGR